MILPAVFLFLLTIIVVAGLYLLSKADIHEKERRDSIFLIASLFLVILALNEVQNINSMNSIIYNESHSRFVDIFPVNDVVDGVEFQDTLNETLSDLLAPKNYTQLLLVKTRSQQMDKLQGMIGQIKQKFDQNGQSSAQLKFSDQSQLCWVKGLAQTVYQNIMDFSKRQVEAGKPIPTLFVEYAVSPDRTKHELHPWPQLLSTAYQQGIINLVFYGNSQTIDTLNSESDVLYWYSKVVETDLI